MRWPGWPFRISFTADLTFGPVAPIDEAPDVVDKQPSDTTVSYHEKPPELGLTSRR